MKDTGHPETDSDTEPTGGGRAYGGGGVRGVGRVSRGRGCCKNNLHPAQGQPSSLDSGFLPWPQSPEPSHTVRSHTGGSGVGNTHE